MRRSVQIFSILLAVLFVGAALRGALTSKEKAKWAAAPGMAVARSGACAVALEDGRVLVTGGANENGVTETAEFLALGAPASLAAPMAMARTGHLCVALDDGTVLVAGGRAAGDAATASAEIYDPALNSWRAIPWMGSARAGATASLLKDGRVLIAGGEAGSEPLASLEIFDPESQSFSPVMSALSAPRKDHAAAVLKDGRVLIAGGFDGKAPIDTIDLFDPASGEVMPLAKMTSPRAGLTATTLLDGRVFLAGGNNGNRDLASTEIFDPVKGSITESASLDVPRRGHLAFRIPNNNSVMIVGGMWDKDSVNAAGLYIPWRDSYEPMDNLPAGRAGAAATPVGDKGLFIVAGGSAKLAATDKTLFATLWTVMTDKSDYYPGEWVNISGTNWTVGNKVDLVVKLLPERSIIRWQKLGADAVTVAPDHTISVPNAFQVNLEDAGKIFELTAVEQGTGLTADAWVFTDGSLLIRSAPTGVTFTLPWTRYQDSGCTIPGGTPPPANSGNASITNSYSAVGNKDEYYKLTAPTSLSGGWTFQSWTNDETSVVTTANPICVLRPSSGNVHYTATYSASNTPPTISASSPSVTVNEGQTAANAGTWGDANSGDTVTLSASVGTVIKGGTNASGTWSWSYNTTDGPAQSQTVTITANDGNGGITTTTFALTVVNVAPTAAFNAPVSVNEGSPISLSLTSPSDPSSVDAVSLTYAFDCGSGYSAFSPTNSASCPTTENGSRTVRGKIQDKDAGVTEYSASVTINNVSPTVAIGGAPASSPEGTAISLTSTVTDPGTADTFTYAWSVTKNGSPYASGAAASFSFTPDDNGSFVVSLTVTDDDGGVGTAASKTITVTNVTPTFSSIGVTPTSINENASATLTVVFADPGTADVHTLQINWGDTSPVEMYTVTPTGSRTFSISHQYKDDNPTGTPLDPNTINVTLADDEGGVANGNTSITVNNVAPTIISVTAPVDPKPVNTAVDVVAVLTDPGTQDTFTCEVTWDDAVVSKGTASAGASSCKATRAFTAAGVYSYSIKLTDDDTGSATYTSTTYVVVYDPSAGFVTGGGWINSPLGAYITDPAMIGKANFGFVSKYKKGATVPEGNTEFQFHAAKMNFSSTNYQWLVVAGARAQYKGAGTINGAGNYGFLLTAIDGQINGGGNVDKFRIKIWDINNSGAIVYDNGLGATDDLESVDLNSLTTISGGSIVIHTGK